jgi:predicted nuclease with TOPRIM domain
MISVDGIRKLIEEDNANNSIIQKRMEELISSGKIHEKLDFLMERNAGIEEHLRIMNGSLKDHEERIRNIETKVWTVSGCIGALSIIALTKSFGLW